jgi:UMF1 family MFS transporter
MLRRLALDRPEARAWAFYDWANSAMVTTVVTAVFPFYYQREASDGLDPRTAAALYSGATTVALVLVALLAPVLGALADFRAAKRRFLFSFAGLGIAACAALFFVQRGDWVLGLALFVLANVGAAGSTVFYDALLPHVAREGEMDQLSTSAYALGYVGGGTLLALNFAWIAFPAHFGLPSGDDLSPAQATLPFRLAFVSVAVWWALFSIPLFRRVPEPPRRIEPDERPRQSAVATSFRRLGETFRELRRYRQAFLMLLAFLIYNDGIVTIIRMAGLYGSEKGFSREVLIGSILMVQFVGVPFAFLFGSLAPRFGAKRLVFAALAVYGGIAALAYYMTSEVHFFLLAFLVATVQGGCQGLSRSLFASLIPRHKSGEFFALFAVGEKFAGILGPATFTLMIALSGSSRSAILSVVIFFALGAWILSRVRVDEGRRAAAEVEAETRPV